VAVKLACGSACSPERASSPIRIRLILMGRASAPRAEWSTATPRLLDVLSWQVIRAHCLRVAIYSGSADGAA
jgi:hypothetical protein